MLKGKLIRAEREERWIKMSSGAKVFIRYLDPRAEKLFSRRFLLSEMQRHDIRSVEINNFLWIFKGQPMVFLPKERKILIDIDPSWEEVRLRLNRENAAGLDLRDTDETVGFVWHHEMAHADGMNDEYLCDKLSREKILQWREGK